MKINLILVLLIFTGCATSRPSSESQRISANIKMSQEGHQILTDFQRKVESGISQKQVVQLMSNIENTWYEDGQPSNRYFRSDNGSNIEVWEYNLWSKILVLTFKEDKLVQLTTRRNNSYELKKFPEDDEYIKPKIGEWVD